MRPWLRLPASSPPPAQNDRCSVGPRQPLLVISPWAKQNYVDNTFTDQASIVRFIEDNWSLGRIGNESADAGAGTLENAFDFNHSSGQAPAIILNDTTGEIEKTIYPNGQRVTGERGVTHRSKEPGGSSASQKPAKLTCTRKLSDQHVLLTCATKGDSKATTLLRARLYRGRTLLANEARSMSHNRAQFSLPLGKRVMAGGYTLTVAIDTAGHVSSRTWRFQIR